MYPFLSLADIELDIELAQRLPRRLAYYHLALPIAQDGEGITVAMVHPENQKVVSVLEGALYAKVIPVRSFPELIRQQLDRVWLVQLAAAPLRVIYWARQTADLDRSMEYVDAFLAALGRETQVDRIDGDDLVPTANTDLIIAASLEESVPDSLFRTPASVLILNHPEKQPQTLLHLLRGHNPDYRVLDWLIPLAQPNNAAVTLLMGVDASGKTPLVSDLSSILMGQDKRQAHIAECRRRLTELGINGRLKIRQQPLLTAIHDELAERSYDLVAIAAEAYGDFAQQVGDAIRSQTPAFLVIKP